MFFAHGLDADEDSGDPTGEQAIETMTVAFQALTERPVSERPRVYAVTRLAFSVDGTATQVSPGQTAINGFIRVAHNELDGMKVSSIDLPPRIDDAVIEALGFEITCDAEEDEIALRGRRRLMSVVAETDFAFSAVYDRA